MRRHLIYHLCPLAANDGWLENLEELSRGMGAFDGARVIAVARGEGCVGVADAETAVADAGIDGWHMLVRDNDPALREVATFLPLLELAESAAGPADAVFYAHSKGNSTKDGEAGARAWRRKMYEALLGDAIQEPWQHLAHQYDAVGACKMTWDPRNRGRAGKAWRCPFPPTPGRQRPIGVAHRWMFAGTFFWFSARVFKKYPGWREAVQRDRYGAEAWLGQLMPSERALSVYQPRPEDSPWNPYDPEVYR